VVAPGFIEVHSHMDAQVFWDPIGTCPAWHGITTTIMGNCGFTIAPCREKEMDLCLKNLERAEDMNRATLLEGIKWRWETFAEYLDVVDSLPKGINYAGYIGHSALRSYVMGERAFEQVASENDMAGMLREFESVRQGVDDARRDYDALIGALRDRGIGAILVLNAMSTSSFEDVTTYASYDEPLAATLGSVRAKDLNLMLHDVAREHDVSIVDNDAMAADLGAARHLTDSVHGSGALHAALRADILRILRQRGVAGFDAV